MKQEPNEKSNQTTQEIDILLDDSNESKAAPETTNSKENSIGEEPINENIPPHYTTIINEVKEEDVEELVQKLYLNNEEESFEYLGEPEDLSKELFDAFGDLGLEEATKKKQSYIEEELAPKALAPLKESLDVKDDVKKKNSKENIKELWTKINPFKKSPQPDIDSSSFNKDGENTKNIMGENFNKLNERKERLEQLQSNVELTSQASSNFLQSVKDYNERQKNKKWYEF